MQNSIALPSTSHVDATLTPARLFIEHDGDFFEITAFPFCSSTLKDLVTCQRYIDQLTGDPTDWCSHLFFPEAWPPGLIYDYLRDYSWPEPGPELE